MLGGAQASGFSAAKVRALRQELLAWFAKAQRDLPWRRQRDGYRVWVSEVMLQQTRVSTVLRYYERFLQAFPDVTALAEAPLDEVLSRWSGLGYYRRARGLHEGARYVLSELGGALPQRTEQLLQIPGIGPYTAGAIASLAYGERAPLVDGNVERVLTRLAAIELDPRKAAGKRAVWALAAELLDPQQPGAFNEALMELGASLCAPRAPQCAACPLQNACKAAARGAASDYPKLAPRKAQRPLQVLSLVLLAPAARLWLVQRPMSGRFAGLWEPPASEHEELDARARQAAWQALTDEVGARGAVRDAASFTHVLTHLRLEVQVKVMQLPEVTELSVPPRYAQGRWVDASAVRGQSRLASKAIELAQAACGLHGKERRG